MTIIEALAHPGLLGALPCFASLATWRPWLVYLAAVYGLPFAALDVVGVSEADALALWQQHTGRTTYDPPAGGYPEAVAIVGVQSGKTRVSAALAAYEALRGAPGTHALLIAQDQRSALRTLLRYVREPFAAVPSCRAEVVSETTDSIELARGVTIAAYPCRPAAVRGLRACVVVIDELAYFTATDGRPTDIEMLRAARGRTATTGGKVIVLSSPYGQSGALWELHRRHYGCDDATTLVWQASAPAMNPTLPADYLARMAQDDPEAYRSEVLGEFRAGLTTLLDPETLDAVVEASVRERAPCGGHVAYYDASGGRSDAAALGIAHREGDRAILDVVRAWPAPHNPAGVIAEVCELVTRYRCPEVVGDRYAGEFVAEQFRARGVRYRPADRDRSALYLDLLSHVQAGTVALLDDAATLRELRGLERRRGPSGRDRVDHRPGAHDDRAVVAAGALLACVARTDGGALAGRLVW
ncbi:MAG: hypothetical protein IT179_13500 [Acidobacteria bacterium]|nr:hypothetical protein [Acidobacteriota bacterium]